MTLSKAKKKERKKYRRFRAMNYGYRRCVKCGRDMIYQTHHKYCNTCWKIIHNR